MAEFEFLDPGPLIDGDLALVLTEQTPADPSRNWAPAYTFRMQLPGGEEAGSINLRIGEQEALVRYGGHIGYGVNPEHRGHHYAARAVRLLLPFARRHGLQTVWITCNPDNWASRRLGAVYVRSSISPSRVSRDQSSWWSATVTCAVK